ncbi:hypothetical protein A1Q2_00167 [Trichosporon asahii var. asahii CBS 8904]|uniref:Ricin B lectin domain-containing protein n=1 Tax=Trichosporon asahii var. asahii (strain CBS 8904) TaxID=1220162 RepID=K1W9V2_TRIAC|nr:hypothetical protein A1Q2_00167 [Trichosporon asahii var. asahii CBS 8904]
MLTYLTLIGIASTVAAKGAYIEWAGGGDARFLSATSDYLFDGTSQYEYIGAGTWTWNTTGEPAPLRFKFLDTGLCLSVIGARLELSKCDTATQWRFVQVDDHGSRIKLEGTGECRE